MVKVAHTTNIFMNMYSILYFLQLQLDLIHHLSQEGVPNIKLFIKKGKNSKIKKKKFLFDIF